MIEIVGITSEVNQKHTIELDGGDVEIVLKYHEMIEEWTIDVKKGDFEKKGVKLVSGIRLFRNSSSGFYIIALCEDDFDPFLIDDFSVGRCKLFLEEF